MRTPADPSELGFNHHDRQRLARALNQTKETRLFRRFQAVLLVAEGHGVADVAYITGLGQSSIYYLRDRYLQTHQDRKFNGACALRATTFSPSRDRVPHSQRVAATTAQAWLSHRRLDGRVAGRASEPTVSVLH